MLSSFGPAISCSERDTPSGNMAEVADLAFGPRQEIVALGTYSVSCINEIGQLVACSRRPDSISQMGRGHVAATRFVKGYPTHEHSVGSAHEAWTEVGGGCGIFVDGRGSAVGNSGGGLVARADRQLLQGSSHWFPCGCAWIRAYWTSTAGPDLT
ncbi:hypothetical protein BC567DRAFT_48222 [Phyllosticta citribraziliensis]